jgi:tellurite resistance protein TerC
MIIFWVGFIFLIFLLLALDLGVFHRKAHAIKAKEALLWTFFWIFLALLFDIFIYYAYQLNWLTIDNKAVFSGNDAALKYLTGYIIEKSLSLDNIFVIAMIFTYFRVPAFCQHRVLFWGIVGALILRGIMIFAGTALIQKFSWMIYVFGGFLIITAIKMLLSNDEQVDPGKNILIRIARKLYRVVPHYEGTKFFTKENGVRAMTPLFLVLLVIESSDVLFAIDSIPAIFAVTTDPYLIFTSNIFAILGLRSLYFALAAMMDKFRYLKISIVVVLIYVGTKMVLSHTFQIPTLISLAIIMGILSVGMVSSAIINKKEIKKNSLLITEK